MASVKKDQSLPDVTIKTIGVCGSIGSGKSAACKLLVDELNCLAHIDSDKIGHGVYSRGSQAIKDVAAAFGSDIVNADGELNRPKLGSIVFGDIQEMKKLEKIVWPHINQQIRTEIAALAASYDTSISDAKLPVVVVEGAVLLDAGWQDDFLDEVWVVSVPREVALDRLQQNRGLTAEEAQKRIDAQQERRGVGNLQEEVNSGVISVVLSNDKDLTDLKESLEFELKRIMR